MEEVGEAGYQTGEVVSAWKVKMDFFAERIGLGGLGGKEHSRRVKMGVNGQVVEREMHCRVEAGRWRSELTHPQKPNQAVQKAAQNMAWSKSASFKDVQISNIRFWLTGRQGGQIGLFNNRAQRIPCRTCPRHGVATRGSP